MNHESGKYIVSIDLGTTNVKAAVFDKDIREISVFSTRVDYRKEGQQVEFDPESYWDMCRTSIVSALRSGKVNPSDVLTIVITGQAESLIVLDNKNNVLRPGISWTDERSYKEVEELKGLLDIEEAYGITGQSEILTTWPITKILWLKNNETNIFDRAGKFLLIKDYIIYKLTGIFAGELSVYNFSYYTDIINKKYWKKALDVVGIFDDQLPNLVEPGTVVSQVSQGISEELGFSKRTTVNSGILDHFAGMIGAGNIAQNTLTETTGTVSALATMVDDPIRKNYELPFHYSGIKNSYVLLSVMESGGITYDWFKNCFYQNEDYEVLESEIADSLKREGGIIFLPHIIGVNAPEFDIRAKGVYYGISINHKKQDFARAVMEGITFMIRRNIDFLKEKGIRIDNILTLGGGAKSDIWNQMKSDVIGTIITLPGNDEAACLGAAMLAAVELGLYESIDAAVHNVVTTKRSYRPVKNENYMKSYDRYCDLYNRLIDVE